MTKRFHEHCPEILKPHTKYSSRRELSFDVLDSSFVVATAGGDSVGRGETLTHVHASELAFWPRSSAEDVFNGLTQAVPNASNTAIFIESTANGTVGCLLIYGAARWKAPTDMSQCSYLGMSIQSTAKPCQIILRGRRKRISWSKTSV